MIVGRIGFQTTQPVNDIVDNLKRARRLVRNNVHPFFFTHAECQKRNSPSFGECPRRRVVFDVRIVSILGNQELRDFLSDVMARRIPLFVK